MVVNGSAVSERTSFKIAQLDFPMPTIDLKDPELARICLEAVRLHGTDWLKIDEHVQRSVAKLSAHEREQFDSEIRRILAFGDCRGGRAAH